MTPQHDNSNTRPQYWFCCLPGPQWILFCGITSLVIGVLWILEEFGVFYQEIWDFALPILLIIWGGAYIVYHFQQGQKG